MSPAPVGFVALRAHLGGEPARRGSLMPGPTDRRAVRVAALALPAAAIAAALSLPSAAEAAPTSAAPKAAAPKAAALSPTATPPRVDLKPSSTTLPVKTIPSNARKSRAAAAPTPKLQTFT